MEELIESILTITDDPRRDYRSDDVVEKKLFELLTKQLHKHCVMQAEGSDISEGATVTSSGGSHVISCIKCGKNFKTATTLWAHFDKCGG